MDDSFWYAQLFRNRSTIYSLVFAQWFSNRDDVCLCTCRQRSSVALIIFHAIKTISEAYISFENDCSIRSSFSRILYYFTFFLLKTFSLNEKFNHRMLFFEYVYFTKCKIITDFENYNSRKTLIFHYINDYANKILHTL